MSKRIPDLKRKNKLKKKLSKDMLSNIKLLCFIPIKKFEEFYDNIKKNIIHNLKSFLNFLIKIILIIRILINLCGITII